MSYVAHCLSYWLRLLTVFMFIGENCVFLVSKRPERNITGWNQNKQRVARANEIANENVDTGGESASERESEREREWEKRTNREKQKKRQLLQSHCYFENAKMTTTVHACEGQRADGELFTLRRPFVCLVRKLHRHAHLMFSITFTLACKLNAINDIVFIP